MADRKRSRPKDGHAELKTAVRHGADREEYRSHAGRGWSDERDARVVDHIRALAMDAVEQAGSGHPGTAMSLAPAAYLLFQEFLRHDPADPQWHGRDRFVLSVGHSSLTLYIQLYLSGYGLSLADLKSYRAWGSRTPGHPEHGHTAGVEVTTGPLGQGISNAVGMAMAARRERGLHDPDAPAGQSVFDHTVWVFASDGDVQEGVSHETCALAGHQKLGNLVVLYDDNHISIEGNTEVAMSEDVLARFAAYGWHTQRVDDGEDIEALRAAFTAARDQTEQPSIIAMRTVIAYPAPHAQNTGKAHGSALGAEEVAATKEILGLEPGHRFVMPPELLARAREVVERGRKQHAEWTARHAEWANQQPERAAEYARICSRILPDGWTEAIPAFDPDPGKGMATRAAGGEVLTALASVLPELWGGSADLAGSNNTTMKGEKSFLPWESDSASPYGRTLHFGVREHGMAAICNGIALHGPLRPYCGTFLVFSDYMRPSVRLAALQHLPVTYVWTHDSIGLGEDGPTHQPVEHLAALRAIPGLAVVRPADANETAAAWRAILQRHSGADPDGPVGLCLTRQNVPVLPAPETHDVARGGYVVAEATDDRPEALLIATGSEVHVALDARERLEADGVATRVVSMPCKEWFFAQSQAYRDSVLPPDVPCRVSVEAGVSQGWRALVGQHGECVSLEHFGASAPYQVLYQQYGLTPERVVAATHASRAKLGRIKGSTTGN